MFPARISEFLHTYREHEEHGNNLQREKKKGFIFKILKTSYTWPHLVFVYSPELLSPLKYCQNQQNHKINKIINVSEQKRQTRPRNNAIYRSYCNNHSNRILQVCFLKLFCSNVLFKDEMWKAKWYLPVQDQVMVL